MVIELTLTNLIFIFAAAIGAYWAIAKQIAVAYNRSLDLRFKAMTASIAAQTEITRKLELDLLSLKADIPSVYQRREDTARDIDAHRASTNTVLTTMGESLRRIENYLLNNKV